jgi:hypothetical protein
LVPTTAAWKTAAITVTSVGHNMADLGLVGRFVMYHIVPEVVFTDTMGSQLAPLDGLYGSRTIEVDNSGSEIILGTAPWLGKIIQRNIPLCNGVVSRFLLKLPGCKLTVQLYLGTFD